MVSIPQIGVIGPDRAIPISHPGYKLRKNWATPGGNVSQFTVSKECVVPRRTRAIAWYAVAIAIACLMSLAPRTGNAQASAGITGTITDPSGAVIPNAKVTITNEETS